MLIKDKLRRMVDRWYTSLTLYREKQFISMFPRRGGSLLGLGCYDGRLTYLVAQKAGVGRILGVDIHDFLIEPYREVIELHIADLTKKLAIGDNSVDLVSSDQMIEHLVEPDILFDEIYRVLRPGGQAVICTENLSAFHNLCALLLGYQAFAQQISSRQVVGNPLALHYGDIEPLPYPRHIHIFTRKGLTDIARAHGFQIESVRTIGYYPLWLSPILERLDPVHGYFLAIRIRKPG